MSPDFVEISLPEELQDGLLRSRAKHCRTSFSTQYLALVNGEEAGLLSFDDKSNIGAGVIYEIVVLPQFQGQGLGGQLLSLGERLGRDRRCRRVVLTPRKILPGLSQSELEEWYQRHGFTWAANEMEMEKSIEGQSA
jgi:GNAT superfamily N-acetyltransferase